MLIEIYRKDSLNNYNNVIFPEYEFHISGELRKKYKVSDELFTSSGNIIFANHAQVRLFVNSVNSQRATEDKLTVGEVNAFGLIDEIYHFIFREYEMTRNPGVMGRAVKSLYDRFGEDLITELLTEFIVLFPPKDVYQGKLNIRQYLRGFTDNRANTDILLEELILLYFANYNTAGRKMKEFFDVGYFSDVNRVYEIITATDEFFVGEKPFGDNNLDLFEFFREPIRSNPDDITAQLDFILSKWKLVIRDKFSRKILSGKDLIREEKMFAPSFGGGGGGAPTVVPQYKKGAHGDDAANVSIGKSAYNYAADINTEYEEPEQFTPDTDWMPRVVILAKNAYVWLDQLSKQYGRQIERLDQVPDQELDRLARYNFTGLWLIGIWERSYASRRIKHLMGNTDAVASAYSLFDYTIAGDLGGEEAYFNLNERAKKRGIRLASDMVPNHTGIFSKWVIEHPEYFIQSDYPPFPNYSFTGENLSPDPNYQIRIEDGYYSQSDAAVVFQRIDNRTGKTVYMYHGNDGTNMPWNDTAQLDMLKPEVRSAVIDKIFEVARKFSIIRFDAAMTLTKKHFSRLWYPQPGMGGDIPTRSDYAKTREEFDRMFPVEFWREVVDRINNELPETLLLAEAFWLLEGYFVRSLGMHRVYNSAFMHMLMKEENDKYRDLITNTLEFEPEILKRYVNFMSNPDEETAIKQFGTDDKYFGVAILMVTLPGLPMFAHGQIEGFTEKYGMEYKRAYYNEDPDQGLIARHERELFPLTRKRFLFSQVEDFWFFDYVDNHGNTNENVFAYSNMAMGERAVVFYNNKYGNARGRIFRSTPKLVNQPYGDKYAKTVSLAEALRVKNEPGIFYVYRNHIKGLEYVIPAYELVNNGFYIELGAFKYEVFTDFREVYDDSGEYTKFWEKFGSRGVESVKRELDEMRLYNVHQAFENLFSDETVDEFVDAYILNDGKDEKNLKARKLFNKYHYLLNTVKHHFDLKNDLTDSMAEFESYCNAVRKLNDIADNKFNIKLNLKYGSALHSLKLHSDNDYRKSAVIFLWFLAVSELKYLFSTKDKSKENYLDSLLLDYPVERVLKQLGKGDYEVFMDKTLINIILENERELFNITGARISEVEDKDVTIGEYIAKHKADLIRDLLENEFVRAYIGINYYQDVWYYSKENYEELLDWIFTLYSLKYIVQREDELKKVLTKSKNGKLTEDDKPLIPLQEKILKAYFVFDYLKTLSKQSGYKLESFKTRIMVADKKVVKPVKKEEKAKPESKKKTKPKKEK